jgi:hypothetical protein
LAAVLLLLPFRRLLVGEERLRSEGDRPLQRGDGAVGHTPCRSGLPSEVRGDVGALVAPCAGGDAGWPATGSGASSATAITIGTLAEVRNPWLI